MCNGSSYTACAGCMAQGSHSTHLSFDLRVRSWQTLHSVLNLRLVITLAARDHDLPARCFSDPVLCAAALWFGESNLVEWTPANTPWLIE